MKFQHLLTLLIAAPFFLLGCNNDSDNLESFPCEDGLAAGTYPCENIGMYAHVTAEELGGTRLNDIWGWIDPDTKKAYAIVGLTDGISFVDITNPNDPTVVGVLPESRVSAKRLNLVTSDLEICEFGIGSTEAAKKLTEGSVWRDHKVHNNHLYVVSDAQAHGMQIFDLTRLREYEEELLTFTEDALYTEFSNAHNIVINEETGFAYVVGATNNVFADFVNDCNDGGLHMIDLTDPKAPSFAGCYRDTDPPRRRANSAYIHDAQCVVYSGSDMDHVNSEICFSAAERSVIITDVNDKTEPVTLGYSFNPNVQYSHQGWLTDDHSYFVMNDELDEWNLGRNTKTHIFDVRDLDDPQFVGSFDHQTTNIDHNLYIDQNRMYLANYTSGLRILEFGDLSQLDIREVGYFDTRPGDNSVEFSGAWSNYPFFDNDVVIVSDIENGLFILKTDL